jgi:protein involved in sex pheromone biosynthesis
MKKLTMLFAAAATILMLSACQEKSAGEKLDDAIDSTKEASKDAFEDAKKLFKD